MASRSAAPQTKMLEQDLSIFVLVYFVAFRSVAFNLAVFGHRSSFMPQCYAKRDKSLKNGGLGFMSKLPYE